MNLLLFTDADRIEHQHIRITGDRLAHLREVHRAASGDELRVGELGGLMGRAEIITIDNEQATLAVDLQDPPPEKLPLVLIVALPRPKMLRRILRCVAELGVAELHLINSFRVEKSYWQTPVLQPEVVERYFVQGLEQSRDTRLPLLHCHKLFKAFAEDTLPGMVAGKTALLAHPGDYPECPRQQQQDTVLVIGPEGGFIPFEVALLQDAGCQVVSLGPRILRVENAINSLLGRLF